MANLNPFLDDEEDGEDQTVGADNANFKQLRDYAKKLERENKQLTRENGSLLEFKTNIEMEKRTAVISQAFTDAGLSSKHGALFQRLNPEGEVTVDAVKQFAAEFDLPLGTKQGEEVSGGPVSTYVDGATIDLQPESTQSEKRTESEPGFSPLQGGGATNPQQFITDSETAAKLSVENPAEFARLYEAGRIKLEKLPGSAA